MKKECELGRERTRVTTSSEMTVRNTAVCDVELQIATINLKICPEENSDCHTNKFQSINRVII